MDGKIFNSRGVLVAIVVGPAIFDLKGKRLYDLKDVNIYRLSGELGAISRMLAAPRSIWTRLLTGYFQQPDPARIHPQRALWQWQPNPA